MEHVSTETIALAIGGRLPVYDGRVRVVDYSGDRYWIYANLRYVAARPASLSSSISNSPERSEGGLKKFLNFFSGTSREALENPQSDRQFLPIGQISAELNAELERAFNNGNPTQDLVFDGVTYVGDGMKYDDYDKPMAEKHSPRATYKDGKMYARHIANMYENTYRYGDQTYQNGQVYWCEVQEVPMLVDKQTGIQMPEFATVGGIRYAKDGTDRYDGKYEDTNLYHYENSLGKWKDIGYSTQVQLDREPMLTRTIPEGTTEIAANAFNGCIMLQQLRIPSSVANVGANAFAHTKFKYISKAKNGDTILSVEPLEQSKDIVSTQDISKYTMAFTGFDVGQMLGGLSRANLEDIDMLAQRLIETKDKLPFGFASKLFAWSNTETDRVANFINNAEMKGFRRLQKLIPAGINNEDIGDLYTFAYNIGCFSKDPAFNQKANTWLEERVMPQSPTKDERERGIKGKTQLPFDAMHANFESWKPDGENPEFSAFLFSKNAEKKSTTLTEVQQEQNWGMFLKRIYEEFQDPDREQDGMRMRDAKGNLTFVDAYNDVDEQGNEIQRTKNYKPSVDMFKRYFATKNFSGIKTADEKAIAEELSRFSGMEQKHFDRAKGIMEEYRASGMPSNIVGSHLQDISGEIEAYKKQSERLAKQGVTAAQDVVAQLTETVNREFTYDWLEKNDPKNFCLGLYCNCCANLAGVGYGIMRSNFVHPDVQNLVINNRKGNPVAKSTFYVNREQGYGVFNNVEVNQNMSSQQKQEIFDSYREGINAFVEAYNQQNPDKPLKKITVGMNLNDLASQIKAGVEKGETKPSAILKGLSFGQYGISGQQYDGDWSKGDQYSLYEVNKKGEREI